MSLITCFLIGGAAALVRLGLYWIWEQIPDKPRPLLYTPYPVPTPAPKQRSRRRRVPPPTPIPPVTVSAEPELPSSEPITRAVMDHDSLLERRAPTEGKRRMKLAEYAALRRKVDTDDE